MSAILLKRLRQPFINKELGEAIKSDLSTRTGEIKEYQEKFTALTAKLSEEINHLEKTAQAFADP